MGFFGIFHFLEGQQKKKRRAEKVNKQASERAKREKKRVGVCCGWEGGRFMERKSRGFKKNGKKSMQSCARSDRGKEKRKRKSKVEKKKQRKNKKTLPSSEQKERKTQLTKKKQKKTQPFFVHAKEEEEEEQKCG